MLIPRQLYVLLYARDGMLNNHFIPLEDIINVDHEGFLEHMDPSLNRMLMPLFSVW